MRIEMKGICKRFGDAGVLAEAAFTVEPGEVHALLGENGAGKTTLMNVLTGVYEKEAGFIAVDGLPVNFSHPKQAEKAGICFVHQELNCLLDMTVTENLFLGKEIKKKFGILDTKAMNQKAEKVMQLFGADFSINTVLNRLSVGQRQLVEIAKAFLVEAGVIILDEPTSALSETEVEKLFEIIGILKEKGISFVYITHRMEEIFRLCDRITVMRDGKYIATKAVSETDREELVKLMIGHEVGNLFKKAPAATYGPVRLEARQLTKKGMFRDISFQVHAGEILGFAGLMGSGRTEIMKTVFGAYTPDSGMLFVGGNPVPLKKHSPVAACRLGMAFVSEDRKNEGLMSDESIAANISAANFPLVSRHAVMSRRREQALGEQAVLEFGIKCTGTSHVCSLLSGGNQQKVVFAKWFFTKPKILILDEPTCGIDIGAKHEIYAVIRRMAQNGTAVILVSSELPELLGLSDRIIVMREGEIAGTLEREHASQNEVMKLAVGGSVHA